MTTLGFLKINHAYHHCRCNVVVKCGGIWKLAKAFSTNQHPVNILPSSSRRLLSKALILAGAASFDVGEKEDYSNLVSV